MQTRYLGVLSAIALVGGLSAQATLTAAPFGTGADGAFAPASNVTINTDTKACLQFTTLNIPSGVTVTVTGKKPLYIKVRGTCTIAGKIVSNGAAGVSSGNNSPGAAGGVGVAGGGTGGTGGCSTATPFVGIGGKGTGARPGIGGVDGGTVGGSFTQPVGGGGGGGNATAGAKGGAPNSGTTPNSSGVGGKAGVCRAGAGGGGGGGDVDSATTATSNDGGGGGGGGGGWVTIAAPVMTISGSISCNGGAGGASSGNGGGGGAGGCIDLISATVTNTGSLSAVGGANGAATQSNCGCSPGGKGGDGCINVYGTISGAGTSKPKPKTFGNGLVVNSSCPLDIAVKTTTATDKFMVGVGVIPLKPPAPSPWGLLCTLDDFFLLTLFLNNVPGLLANSNGTGSGTLMLSEGLKFGPFDVEVIMQGITVNTSNNISGVSNCLRIIMKL